MRITPRFLKNQILIVRMMPIIEQIKQLQLPSLIFVNVTILDKSDTQAFEMEAQSG